MTRFVLMLAENPGDYRGLSPEELDGMIEAYDAWRRSVAADGRFIEGVKLKDEWGRVVSSRADRPGQVDGPYAEAKEVVGGYFVIEAKDYDEAVAIASGCPHAQHGWIHVREIELTGDSR